MDHVTIRSERPEDFRAIRSLVAAAFGSDAEPDLVEAIRGSEHYVPDLALVAESDGALVGHVMVSGATLTSPNHTPGRIVMLAPLAVLPSHQGRGIGGALVVAVCEAAADAGEPLVVLEGSPAYYGRFGFEPAYEHGIEMPLPSWAPREAGQVLRLAGYLDTMRGEVVYPPAYAETLS